MSILGVIVGLAVAGAAGVVILAQRKPNTFVVRREATIDAPPGRIYPKIADFHEWRAWSPWEELDPQLERTYSGPQSGVGAAYAWKGNKKAGQGRMEITQAVPGEKIVLDLHFITPFEARNVTEFVLSPQGDKTRVTWKMQGTSSFVFKVMTVFMDMDAMVGRDFERGLENLGNAVK